MNWVLNKLFYIDVHSSYVLFTYITYTYFILGKYYLILKVSGLINNIFILNTNTIKNKNDILLTFILSNLLCLVLVWEN